MTSTTSTWSDIATAPKDRHIDLWAKCWIASTDSFNEQRFPDCSWWKADSMGAWGDHWNGVPKGWRPTHWMDRPAPPGA